jgi:hypothetical protein
MIDIFDNDNFKYADSSRALNNYSVTDAPIVQAAYAEAVRPDYFLSDVVDARPATPPPTPIATLADGITVTPGILRVSAWARTYVERPVVRYVLDGRVVSRSDRPGVYPADLDLRRSGSHQLVAVLEDDRGRVAARVEKRIVVA